MDNKRPRNSRRTPVTHARRVQGNGTSHLSEDHIRLLKDSGLNGAAINACDPYGVWRYETIHSSVDLIRLGYSDSVAAHTPGLLIRLFNRNSEIWGYQYRPDHPRKNHKGEVIKYENPHGQNVGLDIPPYINELLSDRKKPLIITEGSRKADSLVSFAVDKADGGLPEIGAVSLIGVGLWRLPEFNSFSLSGRDVYICFDSDAVTKKEVQSQERKLAMYLMDLRANVRVCRIPADSVAGLSKIGLDDYLAAIGDIEGLLDEALGVDELVNFENLTDEGNTRRFVSLYCDEVRYCESFKSWLIWDGHYWKRDRTLFIQEKAKESLVTMQKECAVFPGPDGEKKRRFVWYMKCESGSHLDHIMKRAKSDLALAAHPLDFDQDPYLLCVENGIIDLRNGVLMPHEPRHLITRMAPVEFVPGARSDAWEEYLDFFVRPGDEGGELEAFLQRLAFSCLTGVSEKAFAEFFDERAGDTGKTTFVQSLRHVLGSEDSGYSAVVQIEAFLSRRFGGDMKSEVAACYGKRLVTTSEAPPNARLNTGMLKNLTEGGAARFQYRQLYERAWEGPINFMIIIDGNERPKVPAEDNPLFGRWRLVPFLNRLPRGVEKDWRWFEKHDTAEFRSAVLWWALGGREGWFARSGIGTCPVIEQSVVQAKHDMNPLSDYFDVNYVIEEKAWAGTTRDLYEHYKSWIAQTSMMREKPINERDFVALLKSRGVRNGVKKIKGHVVRGWFGMRIV